jgi:hypothetical protein
MKVVAFAVDAGIRENCAVFMRPFSQTAFYPLAFFICFTVVFLTFLTAVTVIIYTRITRVRIVNCFLEIIVYTFGFYFLLTDDLRSSENFSMETFRYT